MARMTRTIVSIPEEEKRWLEAYGRRHRISGAEVVRRAIRLLRGRKAEGDLPDAKTVREDRQGYGSPPPPVITDEAELRRRALAAAGRFASGVPDLSVRHDRYFEEELQEDESGDGEAAPGKPPKRGGAR